MPVGSNLKATAMCAAPRGVQWLAAATVAAAAAAAAAAAVGFDKMSLRCKCKHTGKSYKAVWRDNVKLGSNAI